MKIIAYRAVLSGLHNNLDQKESSGWHNIRHSTKDVRLGLASSHANLPQSTMTSKLKKYNHTLHL